MPDDEESRTVELSFSSEDPYKRWWGVEILDHGSDSVRLDRLRTTGVGLFNHDTDKVIGVLSNIRVEKKRGVADLTFFDDDDGNRILAKVRNGLKNVSVGYRIHELVLEKSSDSGPDEYRVTDWEPFEVSIVSVPADATVGVGRASESSPPNTVNLIGDEHMKLKIAALAGHMTRMLHPDDDPGTTRGEPAPKDPPKDPPVDIAAVESKARDQERKRQNDIRTLAEQFKAVTEVQDLSKKAIEEGWSLDQFNRQALEALGHRTFEPKQIDSRDIRGLTDKDRKRFSMTKLIRALAIAAQPNFVDAQKAKAWREGAGFELEVLGAYRKVVGRDPHDERAVTVPHDLLFGSKNFDADYAERILTVGTEGADIVDTDLRAEDFIEALRNQTVVVQAGARVIPGLQGNVLIPSQTGKGAITWIAESGGAGDTTQTLGQVALTPHTMSMRTDISRRLLLQSSLVMDEFVQQDFRRGMAVELDRVAIEGNPDTTATANEPRGIINTNGIGSVGIATHGGALLRAHLIDLVTEVARDNALMGTPWYLMNSLTIGYLMKLLLDSGSGRFVMEKRNECVGFPVGESQNVPSDLAKGSGTNLNAVVFGDFSQLLIGLWSGQDILVDPYTQGATGALRLIAMQDADIALRRVVSFGAIVDATLP